MEVKKHEHQHFDNYSHLIEQLLHPEDGLKVGERTFLLITFQMAFKGEELVQWIVSYFLANQVEVPHPKKEAHHVGAELLKKGILSHCSSDSVPFTTSCFYTFNISYYDTYWRIPLLFIHGIKGSVLTDTTTNKVCWITANQAISQTSTDLQLPLVWQNGKQARDTKVATDVLKDVKLLGLGEDVYGGWVKKMRKMRRATSIAFYYDWRRSLFEAVEALLAKVEELHERTGQKVQIVAHSMGGLITTVAMKRKPHLFHSVMFAGVPFASGVGFLHDVHEGSSTGSNREILKPEVMATFTSFWSFFPQHYPTHIHTHYPKSASASPKVPRAVVQSPTLHVESVHHHHHHHHHEPSDNSAQKPSNNLRNSNGGHLRNSHGHSAPNTPKTSLRNSQGRDGRSSPSPAQSPARSPAQSPAQSPTQSPRLTPTRTSDPLTPTDLSGPHGHSEPPSPNPELRHSTHREHDEELVASPHNTVHSRPHASTSAHVSNASTSASSSTGSGTSAVHGHGAIHHAHNTVYYANDSHAPSGLYDDGGVLLHLDFSEISTWEQHKLGPFSLNLENINEIKEHMKHALAEAKLFRKELEDTAQNDHIQKHIPIGILVSESKPTLTKIVLLSKAEGSHSHNVRGLDFATLEKPMGDGRLTPGHGVPPGLEPTETWKTTEDHSRLLNDPNVEHYLLSLITRNHSLNSWNLFRERSADNRI